MRHEIRIPKPMLSILLAAGTLALSGTGLVAQAASLRTGQTGAPPQQHARLLVHSGQQITADRGQTRSKGNIRGQFAATPESELTSTTPPALIPVKYEFRGGRSAGRPANLLPGRQPWLTKEEKEQLRKKQMDIR